MNWHIAIEVVLGALTFAVGVNFWAIVKSPSHFARLLGDRNELAKILAFFGPGLDEQAEGVKPVFGSFADNISVFRRAHFGALATTRNMLVVVLVALCVGSELLGITYLVINLGLFLLPAVFPLPGSAVDNNVGHVREVAVNLLKWHRQDPDACAAYCGLADSSVGILHEMLVARK